MPDTPAAIASAPKTPTPPSVAKSSPAESLPAKPGTGKPGEQEAFSNTLRWKTASEQENFGYDVFRAESQDGPFEQINSEVIEGAFDSDEENSYSYTDSTIDPSKPYWYYVESISMSGERERFTPILPAKAKLPATDK